MHAVMQAPSRRLPPATACPDRVEPAADKPLKRDQAEHQVGLVRVLLARARQSALAAHDQHCGGNSRLRNPRGVVQRAAWQPSILDLRLGGHHPG